MRRNYNARLHTERNLMDIQYEFPSIPPMEPLPREEALDIQISHWELRLSELEFARRLAIGQLAALNAMRST